MHDDYGTTYEERAQNAENKVARLEARLVEANTKLSLCAHHVHGSYDLLNTALLPEAVTDDVLVLSVARGAANLRSRLAEDEKLYDELNNDYVLVRNNRDEIARELGETNEALAACQSQGAGLQARLADLEAERELIVQRAENAERAVAEADALRRDLVEIVRMRGAQLAEAEAMLQLIAGHRQAVAFFAPQLAGVVAALDRIDAHLSREKP